MSFNRGRQLRELRLQKGYSQRELADRAEVTSGFISQVEQNKSNPSISTLRRMLDALETTMAEFYTRELQPSSQYFFKKDELVDIGNGDVEYWLVGAGRHGRKMDLLHEMYPPKADSGMIKHTGHEAGVVVSGCIELTVGDETAVLQVGDAYYFESRIPHRFNNIGDVECHIISANTPPSI